MDGSALVVKIDKLLKERKIKRQALADFCDINVQSFADWTRRGTLPNIDVGLKIAKFLGVSAEWLLDDNHEKSWIKYDDNSSTIGIWMSPSAIIRRIELIIRQRLPMDSGIDPWNHNEKFFESISDIISYEQIKNAYQNHYEPTIIQLYELSKRFSVSLEWLVTNEERNHMENNTRFLLGLANNYEEFLKFYHCLPESDKTQINNLVVHLFHSRRQIREKLLEKGVDVDDVPDLIH